MSNKQDDPTTNNTPLHHQPLAIQNGIAYQKGLDNHFETEAVPHALPMHRNNPKVCPLNLYAEQISGTAFTSPRCINRRTWLYRSLPSVAGTSSGFRDTGALFGHVDLGQDLVLDPNPMRWMPFVNGMVGSDNGGDDNDGKTASSPEDRINFINGVRTMVASGDDPVQKNGIAIHMYSFNTNMRNASQNQYMYNSDGNFLIVPQLKSLHVETELGTMVVHPQEFCVIPRGIVFSVNIYQGQDECNKDDNENGSSEGMGITARGYILEVFGGHFHLPELGPIGSNGLANARDFYIPTARFDEPTESMDGTSHAIFNKFGNAIFTRSNPHSPFNVVAWHGNYVPFKYNLNHFCCIHSVTYDHPDPSIYTVLTVPSAEVGTALADFVVFPANRVMATDANTFRPPWFHRNCMSEFMGLISGSYDAKADFIPGGCSLHNCMTAHGPDTISFQKATEKDCSLPERFNGGLAFMFETKCILKVSKFALGCKERERDYATCWDGLEDHFSHRT